MPDCIPQFFKKHAPAEIICMFVETHCHASHLNDIIITAVETHRHASLQIKLSEPQIDADVMMDMIPLSGMVSWQSFNHPAQPRVPGAVLTGKLCIASLLLSNNIDYCQYFYYIGKKWRRHANEVR